ncbi:MAG: C_GCAxxG_C_C family protein [Anaerolineales bacterium]|nr:C_GCAxxG_C_C family protein [Anaerolineales bacterium]
MKNRIETAFSQFDNGFNCAQSVVTSFCDDLGIDKDTALRLSCGFGGGIGRKGEVCGTVTGGIIIIGAKHGKDTQGNKENMDVTYSKTRELMDFVAEKHGSYLCRTLIKDCDLTTEEGQNRFKELDLKNKVCKQCMSDVIEKVEDMLEI